MTVEGAYRKVSKAAKVAKGSKGGGPDEALHRIRKRAKQLRYTAAAHGDAAVAESAKTIAAGEEFLHQFHLLHPDTVFTVIDPPTEMQ